MKRLGPILLVIVVVLVVISFFRDFIIKEGIGIGIKSVLGSEGRVGNFSMSLLGQKVRIKDLKIYNPEGFPKEVFLDMPDIKVDYDLPAMLKQELHLPLIVVDMNEMVVIKNKDGLLNVDELKIIKEQKAAHPDKTNKEEKKTEKPAELKMKIDKMTLTVGRVIYKDYSQSDPPVIKVYDAGIKDKTFENISSAQQMAVLILAASMKQTAIKSAGVYAATAIMGVGFFPAAAVGVFVGDDSSSELFTQSVNTVYAKTLELVKQEGQLISENKAEGLIKAKMDGSDLNIKIGKDKSGKTKLEVSARKMFIPRPETAGAFIYKLSQLLK